MPGSSKNGSLSYCIKLLQVAGVLGRGYLGQVPNFSSFVILIHFFHKIQSIEEGFFGPFELLSSLDVEKFDVDLK